MQDERYGFTKSLSAFQFLSELYAESAAYLQGVQASEKQTDADLPTVLFTEYPSSNQVKTRYRNTEKFIIHDPFPPPEEGLIKVLGPHHLMYCWGNAIPVASDVAPSERLLAHWVRHFGEAARPNWQCVCESSALGHVVPRACRYITLFPHETLPAELHSVDPDILYELHSKEALARISCAQARVLSEIEPPCILKLSHGYANTGNVVVRDYAEVEQAQAAITQYWPGAKVVISALIDNVVGDFGVQFYLHPSGEWVWLGFTRQQFNQAGRWSGGIFSADEQDALFPEFVKIAQPIAEYLHQKGYFGVVGFDVLQNAQNHCFLVDLNPRLTGITPFLIASRLQLQNDLTAGLYCPSQRFVGTLESVIDRIERLCSRDVFVSVLSAYGYEDTGEVIAHVSVHADSLAICREVESSFMSRNG